MKTYYLIFVFCFLLVTSIFAQDESKSKMSNLKDSIAFTSEDGNLKFGFGGRVLMDAAAYFDDETDLSSGSEFRDIRILMKASIRQNWDAKFNIGFADGEVALKDIFLMYKNDENSFVRAGYFLEPFGIEATQSSKAIKFMNIASTVEAFGPGRNLGVSYRSWGKTYFWEAGLFGSDANNKIEGDEGYGFTSRIAFVPLQSVAGLFHIGISGSLRTADAAGFDDDEIEREKSIRYRSRAATHIERRRFIDAKIGAAENQVKIAFEMIAASGHLSLQGEYIDASVSRKSGNDDYHSKGWYAQFGWLIKGDDYKYKMNSARLIQPGSGSLELLVRYNETDLNDSNALIMGGKQKDFTLGCTCYINHNILMKLNFTNVDLDENALNGKENFNMIQTRLQFSF